MSDSMHNITGQNRYRLLITGERFRNNPLELMCNSVTMPGISAGVTEMATPVRNIPQPGGSLAFDDLFVNFIVSEDLSEWLYVFNWIKDNNYASCINAQPYTSQMELIILTNKFNPLMSFTFHDAFPYVLGVVDFREDSPSIETMISSVTFKFTDYTHNATL